eukprot:jgi/Ulvmu1/12867/UM098_0052.1
MHLCRPARVRAGGMQYCTPLASALPQAASSHDNFRTLKEFSQVDAPAVDVGNGAFGRGLFFNSDSPEGTVVSVPLHNVLLVTDDPVESQSIIGERHVRTFQERHGAIPTELSDFLTDEACWDARLCAWLLYVIKVSGPGNEGVWPEYIKSLPNPSDLNLLLTFSPMEQMLLTIPHYRDTAQRGRDAVERMHYAYFFGRGACLGDLQLSPSVSHTLWAMALVRSRTFGLTIGAEPVSVMAPFVDLANHSNDFTCSFRESEDEASLELMSFESHAAGQEVLITYGEGKSSFDFLRDYGFVVPGSPGRIHFVADAQHVLKRAGGDRDEWLDDAARALATAHPYFADEVTDGGALPPCRAACMQPSPEPRLSFGLVFLAVGTQGAHSAQIPFKVHPGGTVEAAALASLVPLLASVSGDCTAAVADVLTGNGAEPLDRTTLMRSCSAETVAEQRSLCSSLRKLLGLVWQHVEEKRSLSELAEAYQVPMTRVEAAHSARVQYMAVLRMIDRLLLSTDSLLAKFERA